MRSRPAVRGGGKPPQQLAKVGPGGCQHGVDGIAGQSRREAPIHPVIALQMPDLRLDRAASSPASALGS